MALLKKLKDIRNTKQNYFILQRNFFGQLSKTYPYLMNHNMALIANRLEYELHNMLCCSLKYKSIKIGIPAADVYNGSQRSKIVVQRGCLGMYYHGSSRDHSDIHYLKKRYYINGKDDIWSRYVRENSNGLKVKEDHAMVGLSALKKEVKNIIPEKLDFYFKALREVMAYKNKLLEYVNDNDRNYYRHFNIDALHFNIKEKSFNVALINNSDDDDENSNYDYAHTNEDTVGICDRFYYNSEHDNVLHLLDYNRNNSHSFERCFDKDVHDRLKYFIDNYRDICSRLDEEEARKKKVVKTCYSFIKLLQIHTTPFKVLNKLK